MSMHRIQSLRITNLWGYKSIDLAFFPDVTILIGENGTGKTTILNVLRGILTADTSLFAYDFTDAAVELASFSDGSTKVISVSRGKDGLRFCLPDQNFLLRPGSTGEAAQISLWTLYGRPERGTDLENALQLLTHLEWLPVNRRLPVQDDDHSHGYTFVNRPKRLESVDQRLTELLGELSAFRLSLDSKVSDHYRVFERKVLAAILYRADFDSLGALKNERMPSVADREELERVFDEVGILNAEMKTRIHQHFAEAKESLRNLQKDRNWDIDDLFVIPLIRRTQSLVAWARTLRSERESLFAPLRRYEAIVNDFFSNKQAVIQNDGQLAIAYTGTATRDRFPVDLLSSGEKQILILLTAALLRAEAPVVYLADEPELSLHVSWQEKLLQSLVDLGGAIQVVVATHSPDIVGPFHDNIIELPRE